MKKLLLIISILLLQGCSGESDTTNDVTESKDTTPPIVEVKDAIISMTAANIFIPEDHITVTDESDIASITSNYDEVINNETAGRYIVTIVVEDTFGNDTSTAITIDYAPTNEPPVLEIVPEYPIYKSFDVENVLIHLSDDNTASKNIVVTSNVNDILDFSSSPAGSYEVDITATDAHGLSTTESIMLHKANDSLTQLYNYTFYMTDEQFRPYYGGYSTLMNYDFYNGMLQISMYEDGYTYIFYTDQSGENWSVQFEYNYGELDTAPSTFKENLNTSFDFSIDETTHFNLNSLTVSVDYSDQASTYDGQAALDAAKARAEDKFHLVLVELNEYFEQIITVPFN